jgi:hypothetical protein
VFLAAAVYLYLTRGKSGQDELERPPGGGAGAAGAAASARPGQPAVSWPR